MTVSDFIGKKVIIHLPKVPELYWYSFTPTGNYYPQDSPYNNRVGSVTIQYTDEKITEDDEMVVVQFEKAHILPNGNVVDWLPISIYDLEIIEVQNDNL